MAIYKFPKNFKWGSATSAHQIEGDNHNDWTEWEESLVRVEQLRKEGKDPANFISGKACDSYNRYEGDLDIVKNLNQNIHRFSIEWSRIEPEEGRFDEKEMQHYMDIVKALRDRGIEPMITLWHFTNPIWFANKDGFLNKKSPEYFTRYAKYVVSNLKDQVGLWITFNEALTVYAGFTKLNAVWPSRSRGIFNFLRTRKNIIRAHVSAYKEIKKIYSHSPAFEVGPREKPREIFEVRSQDGDTSHNVMVGITENNVYVPEAKGMLRTKCRMLYRQLRNFYFFNKNIPYYDFIGLNYYHMSRRPVFRQRYEIIPKQETNEVMNWELYPEGLYHVLKNLKRFNKPVFITENGLADSTDQKRRKFIKDHLYWIYRAIQDGADVRGYLYWSLLDNFEWHLGYSPRFGLVEVDYKTFERRIRPSAWEYAKICKENKLEY